jgi:5-(carboxyamino)imidazole ribonucleotide mutase
MTVDVGIIMGSQSDWPTMKEAAVILDQLGISYETKIVSAAVDRGLKVIIAGAGGAAHLPGMMASKTRVPVIGVPVQTKALSGVDSLYSILQMPKGYPVATMAIGSAGAANAGLMAAGILALLDDALAERLDEWRDALSASIPEDITGAGRDHWHSWGRTTGADAVGRGRQVGLQNPCF